ncbi:MAG TPA: DinB family protein [Bryobacteraceae bacterium]|jgi:uncharacterized damage-inducible protein DinB
MPIRDLLLPEFEQEMANTRKILERVPDDKLKYKPHTKSMELGRLAGHVAELSGWPITILTTELLQLDGFKPWVPTSRAEILQKFEDSVAQTRKLLAETGDESLQKNWTMKFGAETILSMPRYSVLRNVVFNHIIHHRAQLGVFLRLNDVELPGMYGPSADEMKFWDQKTAASKS